MIVDPEQRRSTNVEDVSSGIPYLINLLFGKGIDRYNAAMNKDQFYDPNRKAYEINDSPLAKDAGIQDLLKLMSGR